MKAKKWNPGMAVSVHLMDNQDPKGPSIRVSQIQATRRRRLALKRRSNRVRVIIFNDSNETMQISLQSDGVLMMNTLVAGKTEWTMYHGWAEFWKKEIYIRWVKPGRGKLEGMARVVELYDRSL